MSDFEIEDGYVVVTWPDSQELMDQEWFDECELINGEEELQIYGPSAYIVPSERYAELLLNYNPEI